MTIENKETQYIYDKNNDKIVKKINRKRLLRRFIV